MFYLSRILHGVERRPVALLFAVLLICVVPARADHGEVDRHVAKRLDNMQDLATALEGLVRMTTGVTPYDRKRARQFQKVLERESRRIRSAFRKNRMDPHSHARPDIWTHSDSFEHLARTAAQAARQVNTRNRERLMQSLPPVMGSCHSCHNRFRKPD